MACSQVPTRDLVQCAEHHSHTSLDEVMASSPISTHTSPVGLSHIRTIRAGSVGHDGMLPAQAPVASWAILSLGGIIDTKLNTGFHGHMRVPTSETVVPAVLAAGQILSAFSARERPMSEAITGSYLLTRVFQPAFPTSHTTGMKVLPNYVRGSGIPDFRQLITGVLRS
ncbi:hypothetical protein BD779DRAFT_1474354 [Infundibulicybe gibba]|nr:hypothetical protein BD779DRAFT_1474354 [Infundibulicybe gibba]